MFSKVHSNQLQFKGFGTEGKHKKLNVQGAHTYPQKQHFDAYFLVHNSKFIWPGNDYLYH